MFHLYYCSTPKYMKTGCSDLVSASQEDHIWSYLLATSLPQRRKLMYKLETLYLFKEKNLFSVS